jgi:hypothetical protein
MRDNLAEMMRLSATVDAHEVDGLDSASESIFSWTPLKMLSSSRQVVRKQPQVPSTGEELGVRVRLQRTWE